MDDKIKEVLKDVLIAAAYDSYQKGKISLEQKKLMKTAATSAAHIYLLRDYIDKMITSQLITNADLRKFLVEVAGRSLATYIYDMMISKQKQSLKSILMDNGIQEAIGLAYDKVMEK